LSGVAAPWLDWLRAALPTLAQQLADRMKES
jgi:hypothetical protein